MIKIYDRNQKKLIDEVDNNAFMVKILYNNFLGRSFLKFVLIKPGTSKLNGIRYSKKRSAKMIPRFIKKNEINMSDYVKQEYASFNAFFTRSIDPSKRPIDTNPKALIACSDALLTAYKIKDDLSFKIKNSVYTVSELIKDEKKAKMYDNGYCLLFRLTVRDYHHYCYIDDGTRDEEVKIDGVLHTVNPIALKKARVYSENSREYTTLHTANFGDVIQIEVGALMVGKIKNNEKTTFKKGDEKGFFEFGGSTVILLFKENTIKVDDDILEYSDKSIETRVKYGEKIGRSSK